MTMAKITERTLLAGVIGWVAASTGGEPQLILEDPDAYVADMTVADLVKGLSTAVIRREMGMTND